MDAGARALGVSLAEPIERHGARLEVPDFDGVGLLEVRRAAGLSVRQVAARAGIPVAAVLALEGPDAGARTADEFGAYAVAVGLAPSDALRLLRGEREARHAHAAAAVA